MKRLKRKLQSRSGMTLVEMVAAVGVLSLLSLMLHTGLFMAQDSYHKMLGKSESQLLLSTLSDLLSHELRYARDVVTREGGVLERYTSINYGRNTALSLNDEGQIVANGHPMLSTGAYGNGAYRITDYSITYDASAGLFHIQLQVSGSSLISDEITFSVRCLNGTSGEEGEV